MEMQKALFATYANKEITLHHLDAYFKVIRYEKVTLVIIDRASWSLEGQLEGLEKI
ncbi:hypothetical protein [Pseudoalteromonas sp. HM-SA03]|uniref:hypothetical protein n=1 Tax=Pseudoalteromonas sp. HM-SA03 TaxID=2029678 RepID=UPI001C3EC110|nr:hypothetical protein [Pseudoalteromonas sp. HM-SA03]